MKLDDTRFHGQYFVFIEATAEVKKNEREPHEHNAVTQPFNYLKIENTTQEMMENQPTKDEKGK